MMKEYVDEQIATLLRRLASRAREAALLGSADSIHDLRVAIRRLNQCLRVFQDFFPGKYARKVRRELRHVMDAAGAVRNYDIAIELVKKAKAPVDAWLLQERRHRQEELATVLAGLRRHDFSKNWREHLGG